MFTIEKVEVLITIDGVVYKGIPLSINDKMCDGCVGLESVMLCNTLEPYCNNMARFDIIENK